MPKNLKVIFVIIPLLALGLSACAGSRPHQDENISYWTCPMHPQIHKDEAGPCPICGMDLVPVYKKDAKPATSESPVSSGITLSPEQQKKIGVKTAVVEALPLKKLIRASGRVAYDPELAVAIREYRETLRNVPSLKQQAASRLRLLGLSEAEIKGLSREGGRETALYLPGNRDKIWVYATLFTDDAAALKTGSEVTVEMADGSHTLGVLRSLTPVVEATTRTITARIELKATPGLRPGTFVNVVLTHDLGAPLSIPKSAMVDTGARKLAFLVSENHEFVPIEIRTGSETEDRIVVTQGLKEGDTVVSSATFFVDSETQLKGAMTAAAPTPECPEGQKWDTGMAMCM